MTTTGTSTPPGDTIEGVVLSGDASMTLATPFAAERIADPCNVG